MNGIQGYRCQLYKDNSLKSLSPSRTWDAGACWNLRPSSVSLEVYRKRGRCLRIPNLIYWHGILCCNLWLYNTEQMFLSSISFYLQGWLTNDLPLNLIYLLLETSNVILATAGFIISQIKRCYAKLFVTRARQPIFYVILSDGFSSICARYRYNLQVISCQPG